jgi:hypothetical protein
VTDMYPERAEGRAVAGACRTVGTSPSSPPAPLVVGQPVAVHTASCESPEQHQRVALAGQVVEVYPDGAARAQLADGSQVELAPWFDSYCPNMAKANEAAA